MHNIEKSAARKGEYVGYANGAWRIKREGPQWWRAYKQTAVGEEPMILAGRTLAEVSEKLAVLG